MSGRQVGAMLLTLATAGALADGTDARHGSVGLLPPGAVVEGGFTATWQQADDSRVGSETLASFDLVIKQPMGPGEWTLYLEGNTSPRTTGVSSLLGEANADAGTALDGDGDGRAQVSDLHYAWPALGGEWTVGLVDVTVFLDTSAVANNETRQFLGATLVNNPTIDFPDYSLGAIYHYDDAQATGFTLVLAGSHGLADNPRASYPQLFDLNDDGKGVFVALEGHRSLRSMAVRAGIWGNTADHAELQGTGTDAANYGIYGVLDVEREAYVLSARLGLANDAVSEAARFASVAAEVPMGFASFGAGVARTWLAEDAAAAGRDDFTQVELYARFEPGKGWNVTPGVQWLSNSGFDSSGATVDADVVVYGLRVGYTF